MKYAYFNNNGDKRILQWIDTEAHNFNLPDSAFLHECTPEEWALDQSLEWAVVDGAVVPFAAPERTLTELRDEKIAAISEAFKNELKAGFTTTSGIKMNADIIDVQRLKSAYDLALMTASDNLPVVVDYDNASHLSVPIADVLVMIKDLGINYQTIYAKRQSLRLLAMAAEDQAGLDLISWS
jgi:hypothetical protein